ncbi:MAG: orotate phosphoribosyltransferase, partial [Enterococcus avium]|nr:orotate phosphoribosyltransferase [Enterococcus avium]
KKNFEEANTPLTTLTNYSTLIESALQENYINQEQLELLKKWRKDPENWLS